MAIRTVAVTLRTGRHSLLAAVALLSLSQVASAQTVLPSDAKTTCIVSAVEFASWFTSGSVSLNGAVDPADSVTFSNMPNCPFYKWSAQMFLWLTSPVQSKYGGGTHVFNSPVFYDVSPPDANGDRTLSPNTPGRIRDFFASIPQTGRDKKPVVFDARGKMFPLVRTEVAPSGNPLIRNKLGQRIEIERPRLTPGAKLQLLDKQGKTLDQAARVLDRAGKGIDLKDARLVLNGRPFIVTKSGVAIDFEQGQADGSVLMAQNNSLVYYALQVNDVFAYLRTGQANGAIAATQFPTTPANLNAIVNFALAHNKSLPDANALAIELKSSWIDATGLANPGDYVTISARIPNYNTSSTTQWVPDGTSKVVQLAMVGMHVVGSTAGHPEMLWATFEHVNNAPNAQYTYRDAANVVKTVPQNSVGTWLFSTSGAGTFNVQRMELSGSNIVALAGKTIGPSDILRVNPWGSNTTSPTSTTPNTDIISINNSVINQLAAGDVRRKYIMTGTTWTIGGAAPTGGNEVGTNQMANATLETFFQPSNCFSCHGTNQFPVSHIYNAIKPLFP